MKLLYEFREQLELTRLIEKENPSFYENKNGVQSYFYLERTEGLRVIEILKIMPKTGLVRIC